MTFEDFLHALRQVNATWRLDSQGAIRCTINRQTCCPITALGFGPMFAYRRVAQHLGLDPTLAGEIAYSADHGIGDPEMRAALLRATVNKPTEQQYDAMLHSSEVMTMTAVKEFIRLWGGTLVDESRGVVLSPGGKVHHVIVNRVGSWTPQPVFPSLEAAEDFYRSPEFPNIHYQEED